jgi:hypothetical protein
LVIFDVVERIIREARAASPELPSAGDDDDDHYFVHHKSMYFSIDSLLPT